MQKEQNSSNRTIKKCRRTKSPAFLNPNKHSIAAYNVIVYGDLRDAENVEDILNWYKKVCNKIRDYDTRLSLRQSFIQVIDENLNKEFVLSDRF